MRTTPKTRSASPQLGGCGIALLSEKDLEDIHLASLETLERIGVWVEADDAIDVFSDGGCRIDSETRMVRIPPQVVEEAIRSAPTQFTMFGRDPKHDVMFGDGQAKFSNFGEALMTNDLASGVNRPSTLQDNADAAKICDWASEIDLCQTTAAPRDLSSPVPQAYVYEAVLPNTTKPVMVGPLTVDDMQACIDIAAAVVGGTDELRDRPILCGVCCPVSPLTITRECSDIALVLARAGLADFVCTMGMAGGTAPQTLAGTLVIDNAEDLAVITLIQLAGREAPVWYGASSIAMDLRFGGSPVGTPEAALLNACMAQMARRHGIPSILAGL